MIFLVIANPGTAQVESIVGIWEADDESESSFERHYVLRLLEEEKWTAIYMAPGVCLVQMGNKLEKSASNLIALMRLIWLEVIKRGRS